MSKKRRLSDSDESETKRRKLISSNVTVNIQNTADKERMNDVEFIIGKEKEIFSGIRALFSAQSEPLEAMLYGQMFESFPNNQVIIEDISPTAFQYFRDIVYLKKPSLQLNNVIDVMYLGRKYLIKSIYTNCIKKIKSIHNSDDFFIIFQHLCHYQASIFEKFTMKFLNGAIEFDDVKNETGECCEVHFDVRTIVKNNKFNETVTPSMFALIMKTYFFSEKDKNRTRLKYEVLRDYAKYKVSVSGCDGNGNNDHEWQTVFNQHFAKYIQFQALPNDYLMSVVYKDNVISAEKVINLIDSDQYGFSLKAKLLSKTELFSLCNGEKIYYRLANGEFLEVRVEIGYGELILFNNSRNFRETIKVDDASNKCLHIKTLKGRKGITKKCMADKRVGDCIVVNGDINYRFGEIECKIEAINDDGQIRVDYMYLRQMYVHGDSKEECSCTNYDCPYCVRSPYQ